MSPTMKGYSWHSDLLLRPSAASHPFHVAQAFIPGSPCSTPTQILECEVNSGLGSYRKLGDWVLDPQSLEEQTHA